MRLQTIVAALCLVAAAIFALMNRGLVLETGTVQLPWGTYTAPVVGATLALAAAAVLLLLLVGTADAALANRAQRLVAARLAQRERELAEMKSRAYDDVSQKVDTLREDLTRQIASLNKMIEERFMVADHASD